MKYGEHLKANISPEYGPGPYLNYTELDDIIRNLAVIGPSRYGELKRKKHSEETMRYQSGDRTIATAFPLCSVAQPCLSCSFVFSVLDYGFCDLYLIHYDFRYRYRAHITVPIWSVVKFHCRLHHRPTRGVCRH